MHRHRFFWWGGSVIMTRCHFLQDKRTFLWKKTRENEIIIHSTVFYTHLKTCLEGIFNWALFFSHTGAKIDISLLWSLLPPTRVKTFWPRRSRCGNRPAQIPTSCQSGPCSWPSRWVLPPSGARAPCTPPNPTWSSQTRSLGPSLFLCPQSWLSSWAAASDTQRWV